MMPSDSASAKPWRAAVMVYHTEYSGMHFGLFYVAEFVNLFIVAGVAATIFLGGWMPLHISGWEGFNAAMDYIPGFVLSLIHI